MTYKGKRLAAIWVLWVVATILAAALPTGSGHCETLRFVFMADGRGDALNDLINTTAMKAINDQILALSPRPAFVVHGGDQSYRGYSTLHGRGGYNFKKFKDVMKPVTDAGIKLYAVLGNHELYRDESKEIEIGGIEVGDFFIANQQEFQKEFTDNPANGPAGYERLLYSFESPKNDAFFAVLDCYFLAKDEPGNDLHGVFDDTQLKWLEDQLKKTKATHKFVFAHAPYYLILEAQSKQNTTFTQLWAILDKYRVDFFACGHTHLYARKTIDSSIKPDPQLTPEVHWKNKVTQLLNGTCGAPVDTGTPKVDRSAWHVFNDADTYYFSVIDINGSNVKVTSYGGKAAPYKVIDQFTIPQTINAGIDLMLLD
ncbi:MAG: metallophosphoesterase family protein [Desulfobaccales bacterium]